MEDKQPTAHHLINERWDGMVVEDPETYHKDWLIGGFQNEELKKFFREEFEKANIPGTPNNIEFQKFIKKEEEKDGENFNLVETVDQFRTESSLNAARKFHEDLRGIEGIGLVSRADELKYEFCKDPRHPNWKKVIENL
jgi:hypothetical protein